ncbi:MAG TPA: peptidoglycan-associated lipoprotein Pal [Gemmatimonadaceae bacterium]|jgi:peptidoglycan-associated lipoprotein
MTRIAFRSTALVAAAALALAACHKAPPPAPPPAPAPAPAPDNSAAEARARAAAQARADSIARADAARRAAEAEAAARRAREAAAARAALSTAIYFDLDKDAIRADAQQALDAKVPVLKAQAALHIRIDGNADDRGSDEYNLALGQRRSAAAKRYLEAQGIDASRIDVVSFGKEKPVCKDENEGCWQQNRRDGFSITGGEGSGGSNR